MILLSIIGNELAGESVILQYYSQIMVSYFIYFLVIVVVTSYLYVMLCNLFLNNLSLANDTIRFHSSVTSHGMLWRLLVVFVISGVTLWLAYPWLKIWLVGDWRKIRRFWVDSLELTNR